MGMDSRKARLARTIGLVSEIRQADRKPSVRVEWNHETAQTATLVIFLVFLCKETATNPHRFWP